MRATSAGPRSDAVDSRNQVRLDRSATSRVVMNDTASLPTHRQTRLIGRRVLLYRDASYHCAARPQLHTAVIRHAGADGISLTRGTRARRRLLQTGNAEPESARCPRREADFRVFPEARCLDVAVIGACLRAYGRRIRSR